MAIIGAKEVETDAIRTRKHGDLGVISSSEVIEKLLTDVKNHDWL